MIHTHIVKLVIFFLKSSRLSTEDKNLLTSCVLDKLVALPLYDIISFNEEKKLLVNGKLIDNVSVSQLRESARNAMQSVALKLVHDQVTFEAVTIGVHKVRSSEDLLFSRAAIWWGQQEIKNLQALAGTEDRELAP